MQRLVSSSALLSAWLAFAACTPPAKSQVNRVVIVKVDGLPEGLIERYAAEPAEGARRGHSRLPWIQHVFGEEGTWLNNFYVRGLSLSAPSWSLLDTGRHLQIRGNAEYDRYTLSVEDYLNFFPFYMGYARDRQADMPGVELLDENNVPLLIDRFPYDERFQSFQLLQRGVRWTSLLTGIKEKFSSQPLMDLFDEWQTGFSLSSSVSEQTERDLISDLKNPRIHYLDYFTGEYDHVAHLASDRVAQLHVIDSLDALVGRIWSAIARSPLSGTTALVMVSDHGMNAADKIYSQGYSLIDWFNSPAGGAQHVLTNRHPMTEFKLKGLDPFVSEVISPSPEATYLAGEAKRYPTVVMDLDGNERGNISLRNNSLNQIHILLVQLVQKRLPGPVRRATLDAVFQILDRVRPIWRQNLRELDEELRVLHTRIEIEQSLADSRPGTHDHEVRDEYRRQASRIDRLKSQLHDYTEFVTTMNRLLALNPADFDPGKANMEQLIPRRSLGEPNTIHDLRHYVVGLSPGGLVLAPDGSLDLEKSFRHVDYFSALSAISVRNNIQKDVSPRPVDFIAVPFGQSIWLWRGEDRQAIVSARYDEKGDLELRYQPVAHLRQDASGEVHYDQAAWASGFPLELFEDAQLDVPSGSRERFLSDWHWDRDWLRAVHRSKYSDGIIGLAEQLLSSPPPKAETVANRYLERRRKLRRADMLVFANDHWNFNVRGFNPGGNHGSLLRTSTHSVLMFAGGKNTGIPRGLRVDAPYDSLSLVPTILTLMGRPEPDLPGPVIQELLPKGP